ncbi:MAG: deoxyribose-phosphate aldolase [Armatimonadetes bacterium]|nr:deoxyribose-phosphate aldolase [Armatimonadota bacterium]NIM24927.1 deoxyribose-phosphate aldolase [Armatimonadota bacterium]NIM68816.1 deoxyribose-phosphate aldolase [Armatimonadota bacterium]NIM77063.1 deoxyribose-phosphate aldolase [Armatimonadota bacterium]NIN07018.1 deoxyribose-phosphate aldolase [Armatimonadota bacterium]
MFSRTALAKMIDHSLLRPDATEEEVIRHCEEAKEYHFACVMLLPAWLNMAKKRLRGSDVKLGTVIAFPFGMIPTSCKVFEARQAIGMGASEMDIVVNLGAVKSANCAQVHRDLEEVVTVAELSGLTEDGHDVLTKVILEVGLTTREEQERVCRIAEEVRADFIKTCTGMGPRPVVVEDVRHLRHCVSQNMGIKASGGIRTVEQAMTLINAGANRIGTSTGTAIVNSFDKYQEILAEELNR